MDYLYWWKYAQGEYDAVLTARCITNHSHTTHIKQTYTAISNENQNTIFTVFTEFSKNPFAIIPFLINRSVADKWERQS